MIRLYLRYSGLCLAAVPTWRDLFALGFDVAFVAVRRGNMIAVGTKSDRHDSDLRLAIALGLIDAHSEGGRLLGWEALA